MTKWTLMAAVAVMLITLGGCAQPTATPEPMPVEDTSGEAEDAAGEAEAAPTEEPVEEVAAREHAPELAALLGIAYKLPDGRTITPGNADEAQADGASDEVMFLDYLTAHGDVNGDGAADAAVILADVADPENPVLHLVTVVDENGTMVPKGIYSLPEGVGIERVAIQEGEIVVDQWVPAQGDLSCCPSEPQVVVYKSEDDQVAAIGTRVASNEAVVTAMAQDIDALKTAVPAATAVQAATQIAQATAGTSVAQATAAPNATTPPTTGSTPPKVTMTIKPKDIGLKGEKVDVYAHAFDNPAIVKLELHLDGKAVSEWNSPTADGVPYVHNTFTWRKAVAGIHELKVIAYAKDGSSTFSDAQIYPVK